MREQSLCLQEWSSHLTHLKHFKHSNLAYFEDRVFWQTQAQKTATDRSFFSPMFCLENGRTFLGIVGIWKPYGKSTKKKHELFWYRLMIRDLIFRHQDLWDFDIFFLKPFLPFPLSVTFSPYQSHPPPHPPTHTVRLCQFTPTPIFSLLSISIVISFFFEIINLISLSVSLSSSICLFICLTSGRVCIAHAAPACLAWM